MQREQYKRESWKGMISPFSQLKEGHFCSCPSVTAAAADSEKVTHLVGSFDRHGSEESFFPSERQGTERNYCGKILLSMNHFTALLVCIVLSMKSQGIANIPLNKLTVIRIITSSTLFKTLIVTASVHSSSQVLKCINFSLEIRKELVMTPNRINYSQISQFAPNATK